MTITCNIFCWLNYCYLDVKKRHQNRLLQLRMNVSRTGLNSSRALYRWRMMCCRLANLHLGKKNLTCFSFCPTKVGVDGSIFRAFIDEHFPDNFLPTHLQTELLIARNAEINRIDLKCDGITHIPFHISTFFCKIYFSKSDGRIHSCT